MAGKAIGPEQKPDAAKNETEIKAGRFRRWLRTNKMPLVGALAVSIFTATIFVLQTDPNVDSDQYILYKQGKIDKSQLSFDDRMKARYFELLYTRGCNTDNYLKIIAEVREELNHAISAGDFESAKRLIYMEQVALEDYSDTLRKPKCAKDASR